MKRYFDYCILGLMTLFLAGCSGASTFQDENYLPTDKTSRSEGDESVGLPTEEAVEIAKGGDVSWITEMEADGRKFYYADGREGECLQILSDLGMNAYRFRLWVDPQNKYNSIDDVIAKCLRAMHFGADIMIDFHYSDSWADPGQQTVPAAWQGLNIDELVAKVGSYTKESLLKLKSNGITPKWVQVGNETGNGMLWPLGRVTDYPKNYAMLNNAGYDAVKEVFPEAKVIVHLENGWDKNRASWLFNLLKKYGGKWDVAGFSLYPDKDNYTQFVSQAKTTMKYMVNTYGCDVMLCEVGMGVTYAQQCREFLLQCFDLVNDFPYGKFLGVMYWEPECYSSWNGYKKGAFNFQGRPTIALDAYNEWNSSVQEVLAD